MAAPIASDDDITLGGVGSSQGTDGCEFLLYRHLPQLVRLLNIESIRMYLIAEEFLSDDDMEKLIPNPPHYVGSQIVETLVKIVKRKGEKGVEKFLSALRKSVNDGYQPGHEELLELLENDCLNTKQSPEMDLPLEEVSSTKEEKCDDEEKLVDIEHHSEKADQRRRACLRFVKWCCNNDSNVFRGVVITMMIICLGIGVPQLTIGSLTCMLLWSTGFFYVVSLESGIDLSVAETTDVANATNATFCQAFFAPYHISAGGFLVALGLLLLIMLAWKAVRKSLSNTYKCLYNVIVYTLATFVIVLIVSLFASFMSGLIFFIYTALYIFGNITTYHCHHVPYYWAFVEIVMILSLIGLAMLFIFFVSIRKIVKHLK